MAIHQGKRICSLETEYALVSHLPTMNGQERQYFADRLEEALVQQHLCVPCNSFGRGASRSAPNKLVEIREGYFVANGSRFYYDAGHLEWANPETIDPRSAVQYEKAAEANLAKALVTTNQQLEKECPGSSIMLVKNNIGYGGDTSYGCHENYSLRRYDEKGYDIFPRLVDDLTPFLITRQIFCGAGRIGCRVSDAMNPTAFQLSQRADFIQALESHDTRNVRSLLNLRDEPLADSSKWRRLHLILGDSNVSEFSNFLKLGTTSLVLDMLEANYIKGRWALREPILAFQEISHKFMNAPLRLRNGEILSALKIQQGYLRLLREYLKTYSGKPFANEVLNIWGQTLGDLEQDWTRLNRRLDWAIKRFCLFESPLSAAHTTWEEMGYWYYIIEKTRHIFLSDLDGENVLDSLRQMLYRPTMDSLEAYAKQQGLEWGHYIQRRRLFNRLCEIDFRYHDIDPSRSLNELMNRRNRLDHLVDSDEISAAQNNPPTDTRAWQRGQLIDRCISKMVKIEMDWDRVFWVQSGRTMSMSDPFNPRQIDLDTIPELQVGSLIPIKIMSVESLRKN